MSYTSAESRSGPGRRGESTQQTTAVSAEADVPDLLLLAAQSGELERIRKLVDLTVTSYGQRSEPFGHDGITGPSPLLAAVVNGHLSVIRYLLKRYPACLNRPAHVIASTGLLLPYQRHVWSRVLGDQSVCAFQESLLHCACRYHHFDIAHFLLKRGADANLPSCRKTTPLHALVCLTAPDSVAASQHLLKTLLNKHGANLEARDDMGLTPLLVAARCDYVPMFLWLLEMGADRNAVDHNGYGVYHLVAHHNAIKMLQLLLKSDPLPFFYESGKYIPTQIEYVPCPLYIGTVNSGPRFVTLLKSNPLLLSLFSPEQLVNVSLLDAVSRADPNACSILFECALQMREKVGGVHALMDGSFDGHTEVCSISEWLAITSKEKEILYQFVLVYERCNGSYGIDLIYAFRALTSALIGRISKLSDYKWIHANLRALHIYIKREEWLVLNQLYSSPFEFDRKFRCSIVYILEDVYGKVHGQSGMDYSNCNNKDILPQCFRLMICALGIHTKLLNNHHDCSDLSCPNHYKSYSKTILILIVKWIELWGKTTHPPEVDEKMHQLGRLLVSKHVYLANNSTLLHFVLHERYLTADVTVPLLLEWNAGVAVNHADGSGVQPLQLLVQRFNRNMCTESILQKVASHLISYGAHTDAVDSSGRRPHQVCQHRHAKSLFPVPNPLPLSCLACHCIAGSDIPYKSMELPPRLKRLIAIHDSNVLSAKLNGECM